METRKRRDKNTTEPSSNHLITYKDSFLHPITKGGSTHVRIALRWLVFLVPNPTNSPQSKNFSVKMVPLRRK